MEIQDIQRLDSFLKKRVLYETGNDIMILYDVEDSVISVSTIFCYGVECLEYNCRIELFREFNRGVAEMADLFALSRRADIEQITRKQLWQLFLDGKFGLRCDIDDHYFEFRLNKDLEGTSIEFKRGIKGFIPRTLSSSEFRRPGDYLDYSLQCFQEKK